MKKLLLIAGLAVMAGSVHAQAVQQKTTATSTAATPTGMVRTTSKTHSVATPSGNYHTSDKTRTVTTPAATRKTAVVKRNTANRTRTTTQR
ncbi:hypothetical protein [Hymenobacter metallilatus]|uniref:Uncharacterized protein n=1 Tax=Hymenobacter metallilatus TaxID=2493666 RepID=A0A428IYR7_9BACT|nr:hypothetical protein [Hymenobacter metallilatus]RSK24079.1 hypothetical protein EI290_21005 [Hymenobacter metallilatus]